MFYGLKFSHKVEKELKKKREVKNEAVLRLAGEIRLREKVNSLKIQLRELVPFSQLTKVQKQDALEREEILLELQEGRKAEEEAFKEQREMENNIKRRLLLRWNNKCFS